MTARRIAIALVVLALATPISPAHAELATWDQAKVTALAKQLVESSTALYDSFYKQPPPTVGSGQTRAYQQLKQQVRRIRTEARELSSELEKGAGRDETLPSYEDLMATVRDARENARQVFTTSAVTDKAAAVRALLNQLGPYYDPEFQALQPPTR